MIIVLHAFPRPLFAPSSNAEAKLILTWRSCFCTHIPRHGWPSNYREKHTLSFSQRNFLSHYFGEKTFRDSSTTVSLCKSSSGIQAMSAWHSQHVLDIGGWPHQKGFSEMGPNPRLQTPPQWAAVLRIIFIRRSDRTIPSCWEVSRNSTWSQLSAEK